MKMAYVLGVALIGAAAAGVVVNRAHKKSTIASESSAAAADPAAPAAPAAPQDDTNGSALTGKIIEKIDVPNYTYLHLDTGSAKVWAAVPQAKVAKGDTVTVVNAMKMGQFRSKTLKRTFDVIYFGSLGNAAASAKGGALPPGHPDIGNGAMGTTGQGAMPQGHPEVGATEAVPTDLPKVEKAKGENAERIADVFASRKKLAGKLIRVRGVVVKVTPGIKGKTFLHLRDGSGDASKHDNDLVATTQSVPNKGDVITLEGTLGTDVDIGIGYHYPALLQNAKVVKE